ncbi:MAG: hypothetical protein RBT42_10435 [Aquabacterium sp.]|uniref:hypothetical protein n=1 Tax=Aquabacterium sp. TaxID=1872578 RepID=UPI002A3616DC|nr:hypothetical protein [Aquabacterium sp.]MDX9844165.1 hypothetical protein [Aquabacterium sp.]
MDNPICDEAELAKSCKVGVPTFILVDPIAGEPITVDRAPTVSSLAEVTAARTLAWGREVQAVELHASIDLPPALFPYLVSLSGPDDAWLAETLDIAHADRMEAQSQGISGMGRSAHRIGAWIHSSARPDAITSAISELLRLRCECNSQLRYQRLADSRVMLWAAHIAGKTAVSAAMGPIQRWSCLSASGRLIEIQRCHETAIALRWKPAQLRQFMNGELVHAAVARYLGELTLRGLDAPQLESTLLSRVDAALLRAQEMAATLHLKVIRPEDLTALAALLLLHAEQAVELICREALSESNTKDSGLTGTNVSLHELAAHLNEQLFENLP